MTSTVANEPVVVEAPITPEGAKPSRRERKAEARLSSGEAALREMERLYTADKTLYDAYRRAVKTDSTLSVEDFFGGIIGRIRDIEAALDRLAKHKDYIPPSGWGYGANNGATIAAHIRGIAVTSGKIKTVAADRGRAAIRAKADK